MTLNVPTIKDIQAGFVYVQVNKIIDQPTYQTIDHLQQQLICNAAMLESPLGGGNSGLSGLAEFLPVYLLHTGVAFLHLPNLGETPLYLPIIIHAQ